MGDGKSYENNFEKFVIPSGKKYPKLFIYLGEAAKKVLILVARPLNFFAASLIVSGRLCRNCMDM